MEIKQKVTVSNQRMLINRYLDNHPVLSSIHGMSLPMMAIPVRTLTGLSSPQ